MPIDVAMIAYFAQICTISSIIQQIYHYTYGNEFCFHYCRRARLRFTNLTRLLTADTTPISCGHNLAISRPITQVQKSSSRTATLDSCWSCPTYVRFSLHRTYSYQSRVRGGEGVWIWDGNATCDHVRADIGNLGIGYFCYIMESSYLLT